MIGCTGHLAPHCIHLLRHPRSFATVASFSSISFTSSFPHFCFSSFLPYPHPLNSSSSTFKVSPLLPLPALPHLPPFLLSFASFLQPPDLYSSLIHFSSRCSWSLLLLLLLAPSRPPLPCSPRIVIVWMWTNAILPTIDSIVVVREKNLGYREESIHATQRK